MRGELNERTWPEGSRMEMTISSSVRMSAIVIDITRFNKPFPAWVAQFIPMGQTSGPPMPIHDAGVSWTTLN